MKTAVLYSGHMRSFARCLPTQLDHVFRHFPDADFFVSTVKDADSGTAELLREKMPKGTRVEIEVIDCQPEIPIPVPPVADDWTSGSGRLYGHEPYAISVHPQAILRQLWHLQRVWEFAQKAVYGSADVEAVANVGLFGRTYDRVIRMRADNYFRSFQSPASKTALLATYQAETALTPCWGRFGGVNDRFAVLGSKAAAVYFTTFSRIGELLTKGYPLHPERLVFASLVESGCVVDDSLQAWFSKLVWDRGERHGTFRDPEQEMTQADAFNMMAASGRLPAMSADTKLSGGSIAFLVFLALSVGSMAFALLEPAVSPWTTISTSVVVARDIKATTTNVVAESGEIVETTQTKKRWILQIKDSTGVSVSSVNQKYWEEAQPGARLIVQVRFGRWTGKKWDTRAKFETP